MSAIAVVLAFSASGAAFADNAPTHVSDQELAQDLAPIHVGTSSAPKPASDAADNGTAQAGSGLAFGNQQYQDGMDGAGQLGLQNLASASAQVIAQHPELDSSMNALQNAMAVALTSH